MINIDEPTNSNRFPFSALAFRPFFFVAGLSSVALMFVWFLMYSFNMPLLQQSIAPQLWHAHEMVFAYTMAVIVGFLLTAVKNWTNIQTINGKPLMMLCFLWLVARFLPFFSIPLIYQAIIDSAFLIFAAIAIAIPIIKAKSWSNIGILSKIILMALAHIVFYLGLLGVLDNGVQWGLYGAFYMVLALIFVMARRVVPFFIEKSLGLQQPLNNYVWLDRLSLVLFVLYMLFDVYWPSNLIYVTAFSLLVLHSIRLVQWHHKNIWSQPLLWSLYLAYGSLVIAFALKFLSYWINMSAFLSIHAFAFGIGLITLGMMSRIILGHTGRNINSFPPALKIALWLMVFSFIFRIILPLINMQLYLTWIMISQILWSFAFIIFSFIYMPMLFKARVDGRAG